MRVEKHLHLEMRGFIASLALNNKTLKTMNRNIILLFILLFTTNGLLAQKVSFCESYTNDGDPIGIKNNFRLSATGGYVYILYNNGTRQMKESSLKLVITHQDGSMYKEFANTPIAVQGNKRWAIIDYNFTQDGNYMVSILNNKDKELAKGNLAIAIDKPVIKEKAPQEYVWDDLYKDTAKYNDEYNAQITFTTDVVDGKPVDNFNEFTIGTDGGYIYVYLLNDKTLGCDSIIVDIYKKSSAETYTDFVSSLTYHINGALKGTFFKQAFYEASDYYVAIYNATEDKLISSGYVTIKKK